LFDAYILRRIAEKELSMSIPPLADFLRWLSEMPEAFREQPAGFSNGKVPVRAVLSDLVETLCEESASDDFLQAFEPSGDSIKERNRFAWVLAGCHLLWHQSFRSDKLPKEPLQQFFIQELSQLAEVASIDIFFSEEERREELLRRALRALGKELPGESKEVAADRLSQVDSIEKRRLLLAAAAKEKRAEEERKRKLAEEIKRREEEEAASKYNRE
jgi:hypothetical protein